MLHRQVLASLQRQGQRFVSSSPGSPLRHSLRSALKAHGYPPANQLRCFASAGGRKAYSPEQVSSMAQKNRNLGMYMVRLNQLLAHMDSRAPDTNLNKLSP